MASKAKKAKLELDHYEIGQVFALTIVNEKFQDAQIANRVGADADRKNLKEACKIATFTVNDIKGLNDTSTLKFKRNSDQKTNNPKTADKLKEVDPKTDDQETDDLTAEEMRNLFKTISEADFSCYDAFICFISSHGNSGGILGVDGEIVAVEDIVRYLKKCPSLVDKPKLLFIQNCRGIKKDSGTPKPLGNTVADNDGLSVTVPTEADILVAYSSVDGYEAYRHDEEGSWFITDLTKVLKKHVHSKQLTDMLAIVNDLVANRKFKPGGWKQMPCFTSTLRKAVVFKRPLRNKNRNKH